MRFLTYLKDFTLGIVYILGCLRFKLTIFLLHEEPMSYCAFKSYETELSRIDDFPFESREPIYSRLEFYFIHIRYGSYHFHDDEMLGELQREFFNQLMGRIFICSRSRVPKYVLQHALREKLYAHMSIKYYGS